MSYVSVVPDALSVAAGDLARLGSTLSVSHLEAVAATTGVVPAAADEVSAVITALFNAHGAEYQALSSQAAAFHDQFVRALSGSAMSRRPMPDRCCWTSSTRPRWRCSIVRWSAMARTEQRRARPVVRAEFWSATVVTAQPGWTRARPGAPVVLRAWSGRAAPEAPAGRVRRAAPVGRAGCCGVTAEPVVSAGLAERAVLVVGLGCSVLAGPVAWAGPAAR
jgi:PE family